MPIKILSVDDNEIIRFLVTSALKPYDCIVCEATNGQEGLEAALREKPELILLDNCMPVMDGIEMLTQLRQNPEHAQTPVIMLTAWSDQEKVHQATDLGVRDYLVKPFTKFQLVEKVRRILSLTLKPGAKAPAPPPLAAPPPAATAKPLSRPAPSGNPKAAATAKEYGLSVPENVTRIAELVSHQEVDLDEIASIVDHDQAMATRLLRMANAKLEEGDEEITSVGEALSRNGISSVFLLAMGDLVMRALLKTCQDMLEIKLANVELKKAEFPFGMHILSEMEFCGQTKGKIFFHVDQKSARWLVSLMLLGTVAPEAATGEQIDLILTELTNIVVGNFLSNLSDAGLRSQISAPKIGRSTDARLNVVQGGVAERLAFRSPELTVLVDISIDPWNQ